MKSLLKLTILLSLLVGIFLPFNIPAQAVTKSKSTATVTASILNVREKPSLSAKKIGSLKKGTEVTVYSKTKSQKWSEIRYKSKKAYVYTKYLKFKTSKRASYLLDKTKVYTYTSKDGTYQLIPTGKKYNQTWDKWYYSSKSTEKQLFIVSENSIGLYTGYIDSEYYIDIKYPAKVGQSWDVGYEGEGKARIISITKTVKTPAGNFKNCIIVKEDSGYTTYFAKNIGLVKATNNGKTVTILKSLKKKSPAN
ncbi:SH3 domain-containing protein [Bacillus salipaludis]|uniref:SH3 domain-containing protein n=1 Tax=Bacillus salipaludis TaxID=2547811 RepID=A0AA90R0A0_9BACI|nr:SH3 domain-containing protein [Bacillus salipaludis]MDQ6600424.1 SH3 domain-containing protein [Bacillus salipaludis]